MNVLYLSYDGALDPLGRSQVIPYLEGLSALGHRFDLLTFEKRERWRDLQERLSMEERLEAANVRWHPLPYHRRPSAAATAYDLYRGLRLTRSMARERQWGAIHCRSYPCAVIARSLHRRTGVPYIFDMRGLYAEERVDGGIWSDGGLLYRFTKRMERSFLQDAGAVVTLTHSSVPVVQSLMDAAGSTAQLHVIPTCVDLDRFSPRDRPAGPFTLAYLGSISVPSGPGTSWTRCWISGVACWRGSRTAGSSSSPTPSTTGFGGPQGREASIRTASR